MRIPHAVDIPEDFGQVFVDLANETKRDQTKSNEQNLVNVTKTSNSENACKSSTPKMTWIDA